jgi:hypothetical protein
MEFLRIWLGRSAVIPGRCRPAYAFAAGVIAVPFAPRIMRRNVAVCGGKDMPKQHFVPCVPGAAD